MTVDSINDNYIPVVTQKEIGKICLKSIKVFKRLLVLVWQENISHEDQVHKKFIKRQFWKAEYKVES